MIDRHEEKIFVFVNRHCVMFCTVYVDGVRRRTRVERKYR